MAFGYLFIVTTPFLLFCKILLLFVMALKVKSLKNDLKYNLLNNKKIKPLPTHYAIIIIKFLHKNGPIQLANCPWRLREPRGSWSFFPFYTFFMLVFFFTIEKGLIQAVSD